MDIAKHRETWYLLDGAKHRETWNLLNGAEHKCDNIHSWISLSGDLAFSHQDGIYGFKFPKRFLEISSRDLTLFTILII